jgi:hypothetical protein
MDESAVTEGGEATAEDRVTEGGVADRELR